MKNINLAEIFYNIADILEIKNDNFFKIRAYRKAAQTMEELAEDIEDIASRNELQNIPGIGKDLSEKINEYISTGKIRHYEELKKEVPEILLKMMSIQGVGPKKARLIYDRFKVRSIEELERLAKSHKLSGLPGFKEKSEQNILRGIELFKKRSERMLLGAALPIATQIISNLKKLREVKSISTAGSVRRMKETIRDIDILVTSDKPETVTGAFVSMPQVKEVLAQGPTKSSILTKNGLQVDLRVVDPDCYGATLLYFTGSKAHNVALRKLAKSKGWKINEYGVFRTRDKKKLAGKTEKEMYESLGLSYIPPEMGEDTGEIESARRHKIPRLLELADMRGDLHVHTDRSDGSHSLEDAVRAAIKKGYEYIAVTDHTRSLTVAGGQSIREIKKQLADIKRLNKKLKAFRILASAEVDILSDGSLDLPDDLLRQLDIVVAAIHSGFKNKKDVMTERVLRAMNNRYVHIISHPTGRLLHARDPYDIDLEKVVRAARDTKTALEINAYPERLDLNDANARFAKENGVRFAINTDMHTLDQFENMRFGVAVARRAWLTKEDVLNTLPVNKLLKTIQK